LRHRLALSLMLQYFKLASQLPDFLFQQFDTIQ
jgi:hypothetical protein